MSDHTRAPVQVVQLSRTERAGPPAARAPAAPDAATQNTSRLVDVVAVFDTTGSMSDKIRALIATMADVVATLGGMQLNWRFGVVPFGDLTVPGDRVVGDLPFCDSVEAAQAQLRSIPRFSGGGNVGESSAEAVLAACARPFRPNAVKVVVLLTDEPALGSPQTLGRVDVALGGIDAICFTIAPDEPYFRRWAVEHGGEWRQVAASVDTTALVALFESLMRRAAAVADEVHTHHGGSVRRYLQRAALPPAHSGREPRRLVPAPAATRRLTRADDAGDLMPGTGRPELGPGR